MKDSLFLRCLAVSGALHVMAMTVFFSSPMHFHPNFFTYLGKTPPTSLGEDEIVILKKDAALEEAFRDFVVVSPQSSLSPHTIPTGPSET
jgi:hypothetical protein